VSEPRTEAGTRLVNDVREVVVHGVTDRIPRGIGLAWHVRDGILAIEAEARQQERKRLRDGLARLDWSHVGIYGEFVSVDDVRHLLADPEPTDDR
jgi:hypothetical protein